MRGDLLKKELNIFCFKDLLEHYPLRHIDKTRLDKINSIQRTTDFIQVAGMISNLKIVGEKNGRRLVAKLADDTGFIELVWFQGAQWILKKIKVNVDYIVYGKPALYGSKLNIVHPEIEPLTEAALHRGLEPVYGTTERLKNSHVDSKAIAKLLFYGQ